MCSKSQRIMIPVSTRLDALGKIHKVQQGIANCTERSQDSVWWQGVAKQLEAVANKCQSVLMRVKAEEAAIALYLSDETWQKVVSAALFELKCQPYLILPLYGSSVTVTHNFCNIRTSHVCKTRKSRIRSDQIRCGSDNGLQFSEEKFRPKLFNL